MARRVPAIKPFPQQRILQSDLVPAALHGDLPVCAGNGDGEGLVGFTALDGDGIALAGCGERQHRICLGIVNRCRGRLAVLQIADAEVCAAEIVILKLVPERT